MVAGVVAWEPAWGGMWREECYVPQNAAWPAASAQQLPRPLLLVPHHVALQKQALVAEHPPLLIRQVLVVVVVVAAACLACCLALPMRVVGHCPALTEEAVVLVVHQ